jgi:hypothetical protein
MVSFLSLRSRRGVGCSASTRAILHRFLPGPSSQEPMLHQFR